MFFLFSDGSREFLLIFVRFPYVFTQKSENALNISVNDTKETG